MRRKVLITLIAIMMTAWIPMSSFAEPLDGGVDSYSGELPQLQNSIAKQALLCAYPPGTPSSRYRYGVGSPKPEYRAALSQAYGSRSGWSKKTKAGASCDVFVGTVVRSCGYDMGFPRALAKDLNYLPSSSKFKRIYPSSVSELEPGDIFMYLFHGGGGHIAIYVEVNGVGYMANGHYLAKGGCYGCIDSRVTSVSGSKYKRFGIYRATGDCTSAYSEGDSSDDVKKLQEFLKWSGYFGGEVDGQFGEKTTKAVKKFQKDVGLKATGVFDQECMDAVKLYTKDSAGSYLSEKK